MPKKKRRRKRTLKGNTAGTAGIVVINYFEGRLNPKRSWLEISLAGEFP
jgi:hypothetical protein